MYDQMGGLLLKTKQKMKTENIARALWLSSLMGKKRKLNH